MAKKNPNKKALETPNGESEVLVHSCCAPCSGEIIETVHRSGITQTIFFYNPNIHPSEEYNIRKSENKRFCDKLGIEFVDADYDVDNWFERIRGFENEPERGLRCTLCFDMRFERTALFAFEKQFSLFTSTLGISRWKNLTQINASGVQAANRYDGVSYWTQNWRKKGGASRMIEISKREGFYQQEYCGCVFSLRDTNRWRHSQGRHRIKRNVKFYGNSNSSINQDQKPKI